ncbi:MAG: RNA-dependent ATPase rok1 [Chrysothrix sp. TS-e1954]|nr:MAG: RNA-dependent ATPase rok1 [Chrysothrix sp. TS-e1954]
MAQFQSYFQPLLNGMRQPQTLFSQNPGILQPQQYLDQARNMGTEQMLEVGIIIAQVIGFYEVGKMVGRMKINVENCMDPLKILRRSTKPTGQTDSGRLIGNIRPTGPQETEASVLSLANTSRKRKRPQTLPGSDSNAIREKSAAQTHHDNTDTAVTAVDLKTREGSTSSHTQTGESAEDASKRILKEHRLKITQLWSSDLGKSKRDAVLSPRRKSGKKIKNATGSIRQTKRKRELFPVPLTDFTQLESRYKIPRRLYENVTRLGFAQPTEVQMGSLPLLLDGRSVAATETHHRGKNGMPFAHLLAVAPTGSGKTLAYLTPLLCAVLERRKAAIETNKVDAIEGPSAIVVAPTKELARQIVNEARRLALNTGIKVSLVSKGMRLQVPPERDCDETSSVDGENSTPVRPPPVKAHILVSTPLGLRNAIGGDDVKLTTVEQLVLDEADVLMDPLFRAQTLSVWSACSSEALRVSMWSATMPSSIEDLAIKLIADGVSNDIDRPGASHHGPIYRLVVGLKDSAIPNIEHRLTYAGDEDGKLLALRQLLFPFTAGKAPAMRPPILVFTQTIPRAVALQSELKYDVAPNAGGSSRVAVLHADLSDVARHETMTRFSRGHIWVLITTDLLARGVDFHGINGVVNYDFPGSSAAYVHRVGRTGRAGRKDGIAVTLYSQEDLPYLKNVVNVVSISERQGGTVTTGADYGNASRQWLLESLPRVGKRARHELKMKGVASRRRSKAVHGENASTRTRISTKSGYERQLKHRKRGAILGSKQRNTAGIGNPVEAESDFSGLD